MVIERYAVAWSFQTMYKDAYGAYMLADDVGRAMDELREDLHKAKQSAPEMHRIAIWEKDEIITRQARRLQELEGLNTVKRIAQLEKYVKNLKMKLARATAIITFLKGEKHG